MTKQYGVLVVDDSAFMRKTISGLIEMSPYLFVIGKARNGIDAIEKIKRLKPAIVTLDIEMPELNGLSALEKIMEECPVPVVMLSNGADSTLEAFELGAVDFLVKETLIKDITEKALEEVHNRLVTAANAKLPKIVAVKTKPTILKEDLILKEQMNKNLLIIGSSTGGPSALQSILTRFPSDFSIPIVVIQHMPPGFTKPLAERFDGLCSLQVKEAEHHDILEAGTIYIAPAGLQTTIQKTTSNHYQVKLKISAPIETLYKPSVDVTLLSVAELSKNQLLTVILTGMGDDGLRGGRKVKQFGGTLLAESEETCIVYGMPKVVFEAGLVDKQVPLPEMYDEIMHFLYLD
ncbi:chemotaxis response regulator protein-glutamate methylesterase CheB [Halalkalibacter wakoensis JCM 9140]|uniref:Protein-glutamate methylesterase/protein-glutamine glutaminase n=1 Tax=Halalkalibacter wakoensis JCM 9140 TaxID=1236970 RepID=W4Q218_9BACI|nr:chemotaxis response regulator protein-glutamate methylesterase [Halalkalibacter wakoensis]GAE25980.1 chemotaxis response regulator protein-glutamate methylesterase CheB [Halalkalibacter wakoensis JCM 9140]